MPRVSKEANRAYQRKWYQLNRETQIARSKKRLRGIAEWLRQYKTGSGCVACGETHPACLDFHHIDGKADKEDNISTLQLRGWSKERLLTEIEKCVVMCSNCHRKLHRPLAQE